MQQWPTIQTHETVGRRTDKRSADQKKEVLDEAWSSILEPYANVRELREGVGRVKSGKTGGLSGLTKEHLWHAPDWVLEHALVYANSVFTQRRIPSELKEEAETPLVKSAAAVRPVMLIDILGKIPLSDVGKRILNLLTTLGVLQPSQRVGIPGGSTEEVLETVNGIMEDAIGRGKPLYVASADCKDAHNACSYEVVRLCFMRLGAPREVCDFCYANLVGHRVRVRTSYGIDASDVAALPTGGSGTFLILYPIRNTQTKIG